MRLATAAAKAALTVAYRVAQSESVEPFVQRPAKPTLSRVYYETDDGWQAALFCLPPLPGASGEPVILAHGLGVNRHSLDWSGSLSLARALQRAGFAVYLMEHRGDASAIPPEGSRGWDFDFDDIAIHDVPAAVDAAREHSGYPRVHWIGHAMGGQLLYAFLAHSRGDGVGAAATLCAPVTFTTSDSIRRAAALTRLLLPKAAQVPARAAAAVLAPTVRGENRIAGAEIARPVTRGVMVHGSRDLSGAMVHQVARWLTSGVLCDRDDRVDYAEALRGITLPLMLVTARGDSLCPPEHAAPVLDFLNGPQGVLVLDRGWGHLDPLLGARAPDRVFPRLVSWLDTHRRLAWED